MAKKYQINEMILTMKHIIMFFNPKIVVLSFSRAMFFGIFENEIQMATETASSCTPQMQMSCTCTMQINKHILRRLTHLCLFKTDNVRITNFSIV